MSEEQILRAPFPWFGGKSRAAHLIWDRLGDPANFVEPFFGSGAVLLQRPGGPGKIETVNDLDAWVSNFWRAVAHDPEQVAHWADYPVLEPCLHARHKWLLAQHEWRRKMLDDPDFFDAKIAGWWVWGICAWIGSGWCSPRQSDPSEQLPHLSSGGMDPHAPARPSEKLPMLAHGARGVHAASLDRPSEQLPHLGNAGRGIHRAPHPSEQLPMLAHGARVNTAGSVGSQAETVSANILDIMRQLHDRMRRVRIACGDWERVLTDAVTVGHGLTGVMLDPPYAEGADDLYGNHDKSVSSKVKEWACEAGKNPEMRIAFCGYEGEHEAFPDEWQVVQWKAQGGYGSGNGNPHRERIWFSPACLKPGQGEKAKRAKTGETTVSLFSLVEEDAA